MLFNKIVYNGLFLTLIGMEAMMSQNSNITNYRKMTQTSHSSLSRQLIHYGQDQNKKKTISLSYKQSFYINTNLPNLENNNGIYLPKGYGSYSLIKFEYFSKYIYISTSPIIKRNMVFKSKQNPKKGQFSVLNDVVNNFNTSLFKNNGIQFHYKGLSVGYGNWNMWWGPGIHNSIVMTNNSEGFYHNFIGTTDFVNLTKNLSVNFKYITSDAILNNLSQKFYLSSLFINIKYKFLDFGYSRNILSGGYPDIKWSKKDAFSSIINNKNLIYWDTIDDYYILANIQEEMEIFLEIGLPNRSFGVHNPAFFQDHSRGINLGFRKKDIFNNENIIIGAEYLKLIQSLYYNILPSSNWYDNKKYNYSSYKNRRWAAHSGSDSDDLLLYLGYLKKSSSILYGINIERHGITYKFPPEVKIESRISINYKFENFNISLYLESEYFEHYGFVDNSQNVWNQSFENGSIQRTNSILFTIFKQIL